MSDRGQMKREATRTLRAMHHQICFETGDDPQGDTWASLGADALELTQSAEIHPNSFAATLAANRGLVRLNEATEARAIAAETALAAERVKAALLEEALEAVEQYGSDTLSGRADGPDDRKWQRDAVLEMTRRARAALASVQGEVTDG